MRQTELHRKGVTHASYFCSATQAHEFFSSIAKFLLQRPSLTSFFSFEELLIPPSDFVLNGAARTPTVSLHSNFLKVNTLIQCSCPVSWTAGEKLSTPLHQPPATLKDIA